MSGTTRTVSEVPLIASPQTFGISLNGTLYNLRLTWCPMAPSWTNSRTRLKFWN